jgi:hypothetical protein
MDFTKELALVVSSEKPTSVWQFAACSTAEAFAFTIFIH